MYTDEDFLQSYLTGSDLAPMMKQEDFQVAMIRLMEIGLIEMEEREGVRYYRPTNLLIQMKDHLNSDPKQQN